MMNLSEIIGLTIFIIFIAGALRAWYWCIKKPEKCIDWTTERRKVNQPIDFICRRNNSGSEDA